jgi:hypothetical protein
MNHSKNMTAEVEQRVRNAVSKLLELTFAPGLPNLGTGE